jgi:hypothetical protein
VLLGENERPNLPVICEMALRILRFSSPIHLRNQRRVDLNAHSSSAETYACLNQAYYPDSPHEMVNESCFEHFVRFRCIYLEF